MRPVESTFHFPLSRRGKIMAQGQATKEEAKATIDAFKEVFEALPKRKQMDFIGRANDIYLFLEAAERSLPSEAV